MISKRNLGALAVMMAGLAASGPAAAHPVPDSQFDLTVTADGVDGVLSIPLSELALVVDVRDTGPASPVADYLATHIVATSVDDGAVWGLAVTALELGEGQYDHGRYDLLTAHVHLTAPEGTAEPFDLGYTAVVERVVTHHVNVTLTTPDGAAAPLGEVEYAPKDGTVTPIPVRW